MMALFGLLAANSSWELINKDGANFFAGQKVIEEGYVSLASKAVPASNSIFKESTMSRAKAIEKIQKMVDEKTLQDKSEIKYANLVNKEGYDLVEIADIGELSNDSELIEFLNSPELAHLGIIVEKKEDKNSDWYELGDNYYSYTIRIYNWRDLDKTVKVDGKEYKVRLDPKAVKKGFGYNSETVTYNAQLIDAEGTVLDNCDICEQSINIPVAYSDLANTEKIMKALQDQLGRTKKREIKEVQTNLAKTCESKKYPTGSDRQIECLIDRLEGKSVTAKKLNSDEREAVEVNLAEILKEEYMDDPRSDHFDDFFRGNRKFAAMAKKVAKEAKKEVARQESIEREEERTEMMEDALRNELDYLSEAVATLDNRAANFENMFSYASRDIDQRRFKCDSMSPYTSNYSSRNYFSGGHAGISFNFKDGFQTYSGNYNSRNLVGSPSVNMIGGNNQFAQWQNQWEQMNRQNAEMMRQNCLQNITTVENYWNWELASYEDSYIKPLQQDISSKLSRLDVNRIFPKTYRNEDNYNGGLHKDDKEYYASMIRDFQQDLGGMGIQGSNNTDILYRTAPRGTTPNVGNSNNSRGTFRSGNPSIPTTTTPGNNRGRFGQRGA